MNNWNGDELKLKVHDRGRSIRSTILNDNEDSGFYSFSNDIHESDSDISISYECHEKSGNQHFHNSIISETIHQYMYVI